MGIKNNSHGEIISKKIVKITKEGRPNGPAEHSIIVIESSSTINIGRYLSWITYADLDDENKIEPGRWDLIEPPKSYNDELIWKPFGY